MINVGIDLGTSYSLIGHLNPHGVPALFPDFHNSNAFHTPSVAYVGPDGCLVGDVLEELLEDEPGLDVARHTKLLLGKQQTLFNDHLERKWSPESISALILKKLQKDAESFSNEQIESAVIAVPAQFNDSQRKATRNAAKMIDLNVVKIIEEPVAAATYYGLQETTKDQTIFVYDLGGGTFDSSILQTSQDGLFVLSTEGTNSIGGKVFDETIMDYIAKDFYQCHNFDPLDDPIANFQLRKFSEEVKVRLSKPGSGRIKKTILLTGKAYDFLMTRSQFNKLIEKYISQTIDVCNSCLEGASLDWPYIDRIIFTGGSTLIPAIQNRVAIESKLPPGKIILQQPHQAVTYGASLIAADLATNQKERSVIQQIAPYDLGIRVWDRNTGSPGVKNLIKRNSPLPAIHNATFYTNRNNQKRMVFELCQTRGANGTETEEVSLGHFAFGPIKNPKKNYPVEIKIEYDIEGIVKVTAKDARTGEEMKQILQDDTTDEDSTELFQQREYLMNIRVNE